MADRITDERLREISHGATIYGHERNAIAAELLAARADFAAVACVLPACCGSLADAAQEVLDELDAARADLREAMELLRAHGHPPDWLKLGDAADWNTRYGKLLAKHKETP